MAKNIKETLLGTLEHGQQIMENIRVMRSVSADKLPTDSVARPAEAIHRKELKLVVQSVTDTGRPKSSGLYRRTGIFLPLRRDSILTCSPRSRAFAPAVPTAFPPRRSSVPIMRSPSPEPGTVLCPITCWIR